MPQGRPGSGHGLGNPHALGAVRHWGRGNGRGLSWAFGGREKWEFSQERIWMLGLWRRKEV